jgi:hypothetical protein
VKRAILLAFTVSLFGLASAQTIEELQAKYDQGAYAEVYDAAMQLGTVEGYALAANAADMHAFLELQPPADGEWFDKAKAAADKAMEADPNSAAAQQAWAEVNGRFAMKVTAGQGLSAALRNPSMVAMIRPLREHAEKAMELSPEWPDPYITLGLWHLVVADSGAGFLYGANGKKGLELLDKGVQLGAEQNYERRITGLVEYGYGFFLTGDKEKSKEQLDKALALPAKTAEDRLQQERAKTILAELAK